MHIAIDTTQPISETDRVILLALAGQISIDDAVASEQTPADTALAAQFQHVEPADTAAQASAEEPPTITEVEKPSRQRRTRCKTCGELHYGGTAAHDEAEQAEEDQSAQETERPVLASVPDPEPEAEQADEPEVETPEAGEPAPSEEVEPAPVAADSTEDLKERVVKIAMEMVAAGKAAEIRKVLNEIGVRRVTEIPEADLQGFLDAVGA